ncbi:MULTISPECIES: pep a2 [unclassified Streptomyces]|uniref:pep a2 n=1 Tax=unclassified Streptomyces TaxID=2593676 RepID=UPI0033DF3169
MKSAVPCYYRLDVEVGPERVGQVGRILAAHLRLWDLENLVQPVCHGAELLLRAVDEHAADAQLSIEMWWNGQHLITAVGDDNRELSPGQGLRDCLEHIAATSDGWGGCATATGGRVIWFSRRARSGERMPRVPNVPGPALSTGCRLPHPATAAPPARAARTPERTG